MKMVRSRRAPITLLYATETGKSETFAHRLSKLFSGSFYTRVLCMEDYQYDDLPKENILIIIASTFGSGEAPDNGKDFWKHISSLKHSHQSSLSGIKYAVFALGSKQYSTFCAFGKNLDQALLQLGGQRILDVGLGDELRGQEQSFNAWAGEVYKVICSSYQITVDKNTSLEALENIALIDPQNVRIAVVEAGKNQQPVYEELSRLHHREVVPCQLLSKAHLQARHSERQTLLVRLGIKLASALEYQPGDHLGVFPTNPPELVDELLTYFKDSGVKEDDIVQLETYLDGKWQPVSKLPPCTLRTAFSQYLDIVTAPTPHLLKMLSKFADDHWDRHRLKKLSEIVNDYEEWRDHYCPTIVETLNAFKSINITPAFLLSQLPLLQPRYYSISSSRAVTPKEVHLTMALVSYRLYGGNGPKKYGVCTNYFERYAKDEIPCFLRSAPRFRMPPNKSLPIIMIGAGSGIAPFRSFWKQREHEFETQGKNGHGESGAQIFGKMVLFFGCRYCRMDNIYVHEISPLLKKGVIHHVFNAFSRENANKHYVQDVILEQSALMYQLLVQEGGHIYICGEATMAEGVKSALCEVLKLEGKVDERTADETLQQLKEEERIHEDIFGVLGRRK